MVGILLTILAGITFASTDALGKQLTELLPVLQVLWARYVFQTLLMMAYLSSKSGTQFLYTNYPLLQTVRGVTLLGATLLMYFALANMPLADATSVLFFSPILVTLLSVVFLKEPIGVHRIAAVVAGFSGVLLIVQPGFESTSLYLLLPLGAACLHATYLLLTRQLSGVEERDSTQFNTTAVGAIILSTLVLPVWETPSPSVFALLGIFGVIGTLGHVCLVSAFAHAPASLLSPFLYSQVLFASILSLLWFGDPLRLSMLLGTTILVGSGLYIWRRENR
ncbi:MULTISPECIES: DMT family transporter [unclassified Aurantimonas]|uniref:DMT family transporter n=1 Tax=unclassified Aurantimonas TaxID=2638230 RepID=UPI002E18C8F2|nr:MULTISPECIES: DMT family transporter [unclassified Aurantimonas]MEC5293121.1 DMT family transporter [Aurantimonas sp. C2-3-R2]MEC5414190.1 DMT family transporter [Aurantimonas sp. C2-4-R8]